MNISCTNTDSPYSQPQPFVRDRVDRNGYSSAVASTIDRDNAILQQKLKHIRCKLSSLTQQNASARANIGSTSSPSSQEPWESFKVHTHTEPSRGKSPQKQRDREVRQDNKVLQRKLRELYSVRQDSVVVANHLGTGLDCNKQWQHRTGLYGHSHVNSIIHDSSRPRSAPASDRNNTAVRHSDGAQADLTTVDRTGVPKSLGVASCAGCGRRSFYRADGPSLKPCPGCKQVYYCSETCAKIDQPSHKALCRYHTTGQWTPAGVRPAADCWVQNRSMAVARKLLKQQHSPNSSNHSRPTNSRPATAGAAYSRPAHGQDLLQAVPAHRVPASHYRTEGALRQPLEGPGRDSVANAATLDIDGQPVLHTAGTASGGCSSSGATSYEFVAPGEMVYRRTTSSSRQTQQDSGTAEPDSQVGISQCSHPGGHLLYGALGQVLDSTRLSDSHFEFEEQLQQKLTAARLQELQEDAAQGLVELRASQGLDGPRPCLCANGVEQKHRKGSGAKQRILRQGQSSRY